MIFELSVCRMWCDRTGRKGKGNSEVRENSCVENQGDFLNRSALRFKNGDKVLWAGVVLIACMLSN